MSDFPAAILTSEPTAGCDPAIGAVLWMLAAARERLKHSLLDMNEALLDWQPAAGQNSIGTLLHHLGNIEASWLYEDVLQTTPPAEMLVLLAQDTRDEQGQLTPVAGRSLADHLRRLDTIRGYLLRAYQGMSMADYRRPRQTEDYAVTPEWVLFHLLHHEAEHCGEAGLTRKLAEEAYSRRPLN